MKSPKLLYGWILIACISLIAGASVFLVTDRQKPFFPAPLVMPTLKTLPEPPTAINIPKIGKHLTIKPATVRGNDWEMFDDAVAWLSTSAVPGEGNVILYAHNWPSLWADLYLLEPGDTIEVQQNNLWKTYLVTETRAVNDNDTQSILSDTNRLTLYTCEGSFDQKRRLVYAEPI